MHRNYDSSKLKQVRSEWELYTHVVLPIRLSFQLRSTIWLLKLGQVIEVMYTYQIDIQCTHRHLPPAGRPQKEWDQVHRCPISTHCTCPYHTQNDYCKNQHSQVSWLPHSHTSEHVWSLNKWSKGREILTTLHVVKLLTDMASITLHCGHILSREGWPRCTWTIANWSGLIKITWNRIIWIMDYVMHVRVQ